MRLFTGLSLSRSALSQVTLVLDQLRDSAPLRWSPPENLHITTAFIGEWEPARLEALETALAQVPAPSAVPVSITGFGYFPNPDRPRSLYLAVEPEPALVALAHRIENALAALGHVREARPYRPHVTLARMARENITQLRLRTASMTSRFPLETFEATAFYLYESRPAPGGSAYTTLASFPIAGSGGTK